MAQGHTATGFKQGDRAKLKSRGTRAVKRKGNSKTPHTTKENQGKQKERRSKKRTKERKIKERTNNQKGGTRWKRRATQEWKRLRK